MTSLVVDIDAGLSGMSKHTQKAYRRWIVEYLTAVQGAPVNPTAINAAIAIDMLSTVKLKIWLAQLKARNLGKVSIQQAKAALVWLAQFLADSGHIDYDRAAALSRVKIPRAETGQRPGVWLTKAQIRRFVDTASRVGKSDRSKARNVAIVMLMVGCGLRCEEVCTAKWSDLIRQGRHTILRVHGKGEKVRAVKLPDAVLDALNAWHNHAPADGYLFVRAYLGAWTPEPLSTKALWSVVRTVASAAGLPNVAPHDLRRSFARGAYEAGASFELIRQTLGHSRIEMTEHYVGAALELNRTATDIFGKALGLESGA